MEKEIVDLNAVVAPAVLADGAIGAVGADAAEIFAEWGGGGGRG